MKPPSGKSGSRPKPLASSSSARHLLAFFALFAIPLFAIHFGLLSLPFYWDELGQFIPTALDLLRTGAWVAHSTIPNVHPPGVEAYLVAWYKIFGFSVPVTRVAMLLLASAGLLLTFLLAIELSRGTKGAPAFLPPLFLLASPLFFTQSMMAQLDMPAMVFTLLALVLYLRGRFVSAAAASVALVLAKETGLVVPAVFFVLLIIRGEWKRALLFTAPAVALAGWLLVLHKQTGYWLGDPGFAHYNVAYSLAPVRMLASIVRRVYYLFLAEFRWVGTLTLVFAARRYKLFRNGSWQIVLMVSLATIVLVSVLGGAELERYLLPVLPVFYIAVAIALMHVPKRIAVVACTALLAGLIVNMFWNPPYPFPYENNLAMVDFVGLEEIGAIEAEHDLNGLRIATAWPYTAALRNPDYGYVQHPVTVVETNDFHASSIRAIPPADFDALVTYTRTWAPENGVIAIPLVREFLSRFYEWEPDITPEECAALGLREKIAWERRGQRVTIYVRDRIPSSRDTRHREQAGRGIAPRTSPRPPNISA